MYLATYYQVPCQISAMTNSRVGQGFVRHGYLDEFKSKRTLKRYVQYCLGGYLAEQIIFGQDNVSDGSRGDLTYVNTTVLKQFRENGLGGSVLQYSGGNLQPENINSCQMKKSTKWLLISFWRLSRKRSAY
ncbi:hypothetical protein [Algoriphagus hitonicola]|uniref:hypothetical protein n=1 Tax=Algoriphagus hitonicola TaxID=435880 RepID=UPI003606A294